MNRQTILIRDTYRHYRYYNNRKTKKDGNQNVGIAVVPPISSLPTFFSLL